MFFAISTGEKHMRGALWVLLSLFAAGCSNFKDIGSDLGTGLGQGIKSNADTIGMNLGAGVVRGARDTLTSGETKRRLDSLLEVLGASLARLTAATRDTLFGEYTRAWLDRVKTDLIGADTRAQLGSLRDELLGARTSSFLADSVRKAVAGIRDELLGAATQSALDSLVDKTLATLSQGYRDKMQPLVRDEESFVRRNITAILWVAGGITAGIIALTTLLAVRRKRERRILDLLTYQIHQIPDQRAYDELTTRIRQKAQEEGVEPRLREILGERGILGRESWTGPPSPAR
jgi:hypothetical protein